MNFNTKKSATYLIWVKKSIAGVVSFNEIDLSNQTGYIGYWLAEEFLGFGLITKAVGDLIHEYAARDILHRFVIKVSTENIKSQAVAERLGFKREGILLRAERIGDKFYDQHLYAKIL
jgi:ribosomal-protein-serine acetyltransferase